MKAQYAKFLSFVLIVILSTACSTRAVSTPIVSTPTPVPATRTAVPPTATIIPTVTTTPTSVPLPSLSITLGQINDKNGITLSMGGDVDTQVVTVGDPPTVARSSGNNQALPGGDTIPDNYLQFDVDDSKLSKGKPTSHVSLEVDYFDAGTDSFSVEYDALPFGGSDGKFSGGGSITKNDSKTFKTATFNLCDANFANRDNGADFRISDNGDGAEIIRSVRVTGLPSSGAQTINADNFGADPFDDKPDSDAIQAVLDSACSGDTVVFTSGVNDPAYKGYLIDKTLFLTGTSAKHDMTFTSSDPNNHALLRATTDLKGFVVRLLARSRFQNAGDIDNIDFGHIDVNGNRDSRTRAGNYGSWLPECAGTGDAWCFPGNLGMGGGYDQNDQDYEGNPSLWTTGLNVHDLVISQVESGTALELTGAAGVIQHVTIDTAGDHVHTTGCTYTDNDSEQEGWSDGITLYGPAHMVLNNTIINPSDVAIAYFGGRDTIISNNTITITQGNYGAFGGITVHTWIWGDISGSQVIGNLITSEGDTQCGGLHAGINIGPHMWGGLTCAETSTGAMFGNSGSCSTNPVQEEVAACTGGKCQLWAYVPAGGTFTLKDNTVSGAHINYLVEGLAAVGEFVDENNVSQTPQLSDWQAAKSGCNGVKWGALDKVAHDPSLLGYTDLMIHCER